MNRKTEPDDPDPATAIFGFMFKAAVVALVVKLLAMIVVERMGS